MTSSTVMEIGSVDLTNTVKNSDVFVYSKIDIVKYRGFGVRPGDDSIYIDDDGNTHVSRIEEIGAQIEDSDKFKVFRVKFSTRRDEKSGLCIYMGVFGKVCLSIAAAKTFFGVKI